MDVVITQNNLQQFCRICLTHLKTSERKHNIRRLSEVKKLMVLLELDMGQHNVFPMRLCSPCYSKMIGIQEFRKLAVNSEEKINTIIKSKGRCTKSDTKPTIKTRQSVHVLENAAGKRGHAALNGGINRTISDDEDTKLLLLDMAERTPIKMEPIIEIYEGPTVKMETNFDYEHEQESNAINTAYDSIENDSDDEGTVLGNRFDNSSSAVSVSSPRLLRMRQPEHTKKSLQCVVHDRNKKPFLCVICQKAFTRYNQLKQHMSREHQSDEKFLCDQKGCVASFNSRSTLETHRQVMHLIETPVLATSYQEAVKLHRQRTGRENEIDYVCQLCSKLVKSNYTLMLHLKRHFQIRQYVCQKCGVAKVTSTELNTHMQTHNPIEKIKCPICPAKFSHKNAIGRHVRVVHEGERKFPCSICTKRFTTQVARREHIRLHTGERPYRCNICDKGYAKSIGLKLHMTTHDTSLRKHVCKFCLRRFTSRQNVVAHELRHVGDKPYLCSHCTLGFRSASDLEAHVVLHLDLNG